MNKPEIHAYMPAANGGRGRAFEVDGIRVFVDAHEDDARAKAVAEFLADAPSVQEELRSEVQRLRALVPNESPVRMLGPACVRMRDGRLWLLNRADGGWAEFGVMFKDWDELFRRFNVVVLGRSTDAFGEFWTVNAPRTAAATDKPTNAKGNGT